MKPASDPRLSDERLHRLTMNSDAGLMQARQPAAMKPSPS